jgi:hypothetical protein
MEDACIPVETNLAYTESSQVILRRKRMFSRGEHIICNIPAWGQVPRSLHMKTHGNINVFINTTKTGIHITQENYTLGKMKSQWSILFFFYV